MAEVYERLLKEALTWVGIGLGIGIPVFIAAILIFLKFKDRRRFYSIPLFLFGGGLMAIGFSALKDYFEIKARMGGSQTHSSNPQKLPSEIEKKISELIKRLEELRARLR
ncbi:hypothetical protein DRJ17_04070 [Candidatus Woesearchaeota archaeon]|nr:MAG: hypothetical protein DRJ17_04070 [Candidatus Woesearchaeota archaeon]